MEVIMKIIFILSLIFFLLCVLKNKTACERIIFKHMFNNNQYIIYEVCDVLTHQECQVLITNSIPTLHRSSVISHNPISDVRTSQNTFLHNNTSNAELSNVLAKIEDITHKMSGKSIRNQEPLQVVKYTKNQYYKPHYDCCVPLNSPMCLKDSHLHGYRHSTLLLYLNDVEEGGETEFPLIKYKFKPKMGCGIFFFNLTKNEKNYHYLSKHAGLSPIKGDKWVCNKWIRTTEYS